MCGVRQLPCRGGVVRSSLIISPGAASGLGFHGGQIINVIGDFLVSFAGPAAQWLSWESRGSGCNHVREPANRGTSGATVGRTGRWRNAVCKRSDSRSSALTGQNIAFRGRLPSAWNRRKSPNVGHRLVVPRIASAGVAHKAYAHVRFSFLNPWT